MCFISLTHSCSLNPNKLYHRFWRSNSHSTLNFSYILTIFLYQWADLHVQKTTYQMECFNSIWNQISSFTENFEVVLASDLSMEDIPTYYPFIFFHEVIVNGFSNSVTRTYCKYFLLIFDLFSFKHMKKNMSKNRMIERKPKLANTQLCDVGWRNWPSVSKKSCLLDAT